MPGSLVRIMYELNQVQSRVKPWSSSLASLFLCELLLLTCSLSEDRMRLSTGLPINSSRTSSFWGTDTISVFTCAAFNLECLLRSSRSPLEEEKGLLRCQTASLLYLDHSAFLFFYFFSLLHPLAVQQKLVPNAKEKAIFFLHVSPVARVIVPNDEVNNT